MRNVLMKGAEPFFLPGGKEGVLLVHGLTGSPAEMRLLGKYLHRKGYTVLAIRLPGHGTMLADLERKTVRDWQHAVLDGYALLQDSAESISVVGHSMGALLALWLTTVRDVARAAILATPIFIRQARELKKLPPREAAQGRFLPKAPHAFPDIPADCRVAYRAMPLLVVYELLGLMERNKVLLPQIRTPLLIAQGGNDRTVDPESARYIVDHVGSAEKSLLWLPHSGHRITIDIERDTLFCDIATFLRKDNPSQI